MESLKLRGKLLKAIRKFFDDRDFIEVETPVRLPAPALETHIDAMPSGDCFLRTSPELHMKRLLAGGAERIYQIGPCFRAGEKGRLHNPEYSMLEWYRANATYSDILVDTKALLSAVARDLLGSDVITYQAAAIDVPGPWDYVKVEDAFAQHAGWNPVKNFDADRFDTDLVEKVEPALSSERPVVLADYPAELAALARLKPGRPEVAERWELYIGGIELANAFSELADPAEQRRRFEECADKRRVMGKEVYPMDEPFLAALEEMPDSAGIALGVDRLLMLLTDTDDIANVLPFASQP